MNLSPEALKKKLTNNSLCESIYTQGLHLWFEWLSENKVYEALMQIFTYVSLTCTERVNLSMSLHFHKVCIYPRNGNLWKLEKFVREQNWQTTLSRPV